MPQLRAAGKALTQRKLRPSKMLRRHSPFGFTQRRNPNRNNPLCFGSLHHGAIAPRLTEVRERAWISQPHPSKTKLLR